MTIERNTATVLDPSVPGGDTVKEAAFKNSDAIDDLIEDVNADLVTTENPNAHGVPGGGAPQNITISSGSITPLGSSAQVVDTEGAASSDTLDTIVTTNYQDGSIIILRPASKFRDVYLSLAGNLAVSVDPDTSLKLLVNAVHLQLVSGSWVGIGDDLQNKQEPVFNDSVNTVGAGFAYNRLSELTSGTYHRKTFNGVDVNFETTGTGDYTFDSNATPISDDGADLGSALKGWKSLYVGTIEGSPEGIATSANLIDNANFGINQQAVSGTVSLSSGEYGHDRFKAGASGCTYTFAKSEGINTITITAGTLLQIVPGDKFKSGTHILSWTGTAQARIDSGTYGDSGITGTLTGGTNASVEWGIGALALPKLAEGTVVTATVKPDKVSETEKATNWFWQIGPSAYSNRLGLHLGRALVSTAAEIPVVLPRAMNRIDTAMSVSNLSDISIYKPNGTAITPTSLSLLDATNGMGVVQAQVASGLTPGESLWLIFNNTSGYIRFDRNL